MKKHAHNWKGGRNAAIQRYDSENSRPFRAMDQQLKRLAFPKRQREIRIKHKYGLSTADIRLLLKAQGNQCAICRKPFSSERCAWLCVDHDHKTNQVRALLCFTCNSGLGCFKDRIDLLIAAAEYLKHHAE